MVVAADLLDLVPRAAPGSGRGWRGRSARRSPPGGSPAREDRRFRAPASAWAARERSSSRSSSENGSPCADDRDQPVDGRRRLDQASVITKRRSFADARLADARRPAPLARPRWMAASSLVQRAIAVVSSSGWSGARALDAAATRPAPRRWRSSARARAAPCGRGSRRMSARSGGSTRAAARAPAQSSSSRWASWLDMLLNSSPSAANSSRPSIGIGDGEVAAGEPTGRLQEAAHLSLQAREASDREGEGQQEERADEGKREKPAGAGRASGSRTLARAVTRDSGAIEPRKSLAQCAIASASD